MMRRAERIQRLDCRRLAPLTHDPKNRYVVRMRSPRLINNRGMLPLRETAVHFYSRDHVARTLDHWSTIFPSRAPLACADQFVWPPPRALPACPQHRENL